MTFNDLLWLALAAAALAGVCGGLWVDWKLNWGRRRQSPGFDVIPRDPPAGADPPWIRRPLNLVAAVSLVLCLAVVVVCLAVVALWVFVPETTVWDFYSASRHFSVQPQQQRLRVNVAEGQWVNGEFGAPPGRFYRLAAWNRRRLPGGLEWVRNPASDPREAKWMWLFIPYWLLAAVTGLPPTLWIVGAAARTVRKRRDARLKLCAHCGYDLRATPERCPECGAAA